MTKNLHSYIDICTIEQEVLVFIGEKGGDSSGITQSKREMDKIFRKSK